MDRITMADGAGGVSTAHLIDSLFAKYLGNEYLSQMEDSTAVPGGAALAVTTDSFVVTPVIFPGGDIGRLSVCGTVNDLLMSGAVPKYLTCGWILEEGLPLSTLRTCVKSMAETAKEAGVMIVAGDTKVVENHSGPDGGVLINTAGIGVFRSGQGSVKTSLIREGDVILLSGNLGDHHAAILGQRMQIDNDIKSDDAPLNEMVENLMEEKIDVHEMRDVTRGGLATVLNEFVKDTGLTFELEASKIPVNDSVKGFAGILGLDPLYMGNEGKMVAVIARGDADRALEIVKKSRYGENAVLIGSVRPPAAGDTAHLVLVTELGGRRVLGPLYGEGLPRIC